MLLKLIVGLLGLLIIVLRLPHVAHVEVSSLQDGIPESEKCNLFSGEWIPDTLAPHYSNTSCEFMSAPRNCMKNGRPDTGYLFWRWKPYHCNLRPFNPQKFLYAMRDRSLAMIGDSLMLNQMQSLLCILSQVEKSIDTYHSESYELRTWYFRSYNFTLSTYWAPFLLQAYFLSERKVDLYLDKLERRWTAEYHKHDYIVIAAGPWFNTSMIINENNTVIGCHACQGEFKELGAFYPYRKALQLAFHFITTSDHRPLVFFRTWSPKHFEYGEWFNGGICNRTTPYSKGQYDGTTIDHSYYAISMQEFNKAARIGSKKGTRMELLDVYHLSLLRPDGHPGPYMKFHPFDHKDNNARVQNDCVHWCLPGPIDTWNHLMMEMLLNGDISLKDIY